MSSRPAPIPVVILAGGRAKPDIQALTGQTIRALVPVDGVPLIQCVVNAMTAARDNGSPVGTVTVVGDIPENAGYTVVPDTGDFVSNLFGGLSTASSALYALISTCDLPFLTGESVADFIDRAVIEAERRAAGLVWPVIPVARCYERFPGVKRTALKLREGTFTGGNLMLVSPSALVRQQGKIASAYAARKSPLKLAAMLGYGAALRLLASQIAVPRLLTVSYLADRVGRLIGVPACAVVSQFAEIATDLDRASDFVAVGLAREGSLT